MDTFDPNAFEQQIGSMRTAGRNQQEEYTRKETALQARYEVTQREIAALEKQYNEQQVRTSN
jgi:hypothetical protein